MIMFSKKKPPAGATANEADIRRKARHAERPAEENRFDQIRKEAAARHRRSDTDGALRRARQTAQDNRLL